jgi:CheY-like chemotaxis protein
MPKLKTICIINDDDIFTFILKKSINKLSVCENILTYSNGELALQGLTNQVESGLLLPEIILLDINMPIMNGWDFLNEFSAINTNKKVDIYLISAHISSNDSLKAKNHPEITGILEDPAESETIMRITANYYQQNS